MVNRLHMVILLAHDLDAAIEFYKKLGFQLKFHMKESWAECKLGDLKVGLCYTSKELADRSTGLVFEVPDLQKVYNEHKDTLQFLTEPVEKVHGIMVSVKDPGGNIIDLYQPTPEKVSKMVKEIKEKDKNSGCCKGAKTCACSARKSSDAPVN